jgi:hypothetical protein
MRLANRTSPYRGLPTILLALLFGASTAAYAQPPIAVLDALHQTIMLRKGTDGKTYGVGETDPLLWGGSAYFLSGESRERLTAAVNAVAALPDSAIQNCPPAQRALLQNRVWTVFDYLYEHRYSTTEDGKRGNGLLADRDRTLLQLLATVMAKLALDDSDITTIPDPLLEAATSGRWPKQPDPAGGPDVFLPADLGSIGGRWINLIRADGEPIAPEHLRGSGGRSCFLVSARFPDKGPTVENYFKTVADFPVPWLPGERDPRPDGTLEFRLNPALPSFPPGSIFALIRKLQVVDRQGRVRTTPLTLSVQLRYYRIVQSTAEAERPKTISDIRKRQSFAEFRLETDVVAQGGAPRLRAVTAAEKDYLFFRDVGTDQIDGSPAEHFSPNFTSAPRNVSLESCYNCHPGLGLSSINSAVGFRNPPFPLGPLIPDDSNRNGVHETDLATIWKMRRASWGVLVAFWPVTTNQ